MGRRMNTTIKNIKQWAIERNLHKAKRGEKIRDPYLRKVARRLLNQ